MASDIFSPDCVGIEPIPADQWIVSSLLQKAIRRGEVELAQRAALTFLMQKGSAIWRRLTVISFEDVGVGSVKALAYSVAGSTNPNWRKANRGNAWVAMDLARALAEAPKDRSADYLICAAKDHPALEHARDECSRSSISQMLDVVADQRRPLEHRATHAWHASGIASGRDKRVRKGDLPALLSKFRELGVPEELVVATGIAATRIREPITVMVPLVWLANKWQSPTVTETPVPAAPLIDGVPLYSLDKHTRVGREAIGRFGNAARSHF